VTSDNSGPSSGAINLVDFVEIFRRRIRLFGVIAGALTALAIIASLLATPQYTAEAGLKLDPNKRSIVDTPATAGATPADNPFIETEIQVARSRKVALATIKALNLASDSEFGAEQTGGLKHSLAGLLGAQPAKPSAVDADEAVVTEFMSRLNVSRDGLSYIIHVDFTSRNPQKAALIANTLARQYMLVSATMRADALRLQAQTLETGLSKLGAEARDASAQAAAYRANSGLASAANGTVTQQQASGIAGQLSDVQAERATALANLAEARAQLRRGDIDSITAVTSAPGVQDLRRLRAELLRQQAEISTRYGPRHPESLRVQQQLNGIDAQLKAESERVVAGLEATARSADARVGALSGTLNGLQGRLAAGSRAESIAQGLDREAEAKQNVYNQFNMAQQQVSQQTNVDETRAVLVSEASTPDSPSFPNKPLFALMGLFVGCAAGAAGVFVAEGLESTIRSTSDVTRYLGLTTVAVVPSLARSALRVAGKNTTPESYVVKRPMSGFAEAFRNIRSALMLPEADRAAKVIAVSSALPGEGKTTAAAAFGRILGMAGARVVIVDCDLRRSSLGDRLADRDGGPGLTQLLTGQATLPQTLRQDAVPGVFILPAASTEFIPQDLFSGARVRELLEELRSQFDYVILDSPPVLAVAEARAIAVLADRVILVTLWAKTPRAAVIAAVEHLRHDGADLAGVVLNRVDVSGRNLSKQDYAYYYSDNKRYYRE
jgi:capsular exopolysaccharide synthesis family protein